MKISFVSKTSLIKSFSAFSISLLCLSMRKTLNQLLETIFTSNINPGGGGPLIPLSQAEISAINFPFGTQSELYSSYAWLIGIMLTLEIIVAIVKAYSNKILGIDYSAFIRPKILILPLYPIAFHSVAFRESRLIMKYINTTELKNSGLETNKSNMAVYFCQSKNQKLDYTKLSLMIEEIANKIIKEGKNKLTLDNDGNHVNRELIRKIIINEYAIRLLDLPVEKLTKDAFQMIKDSLFSLADFEECLQNGCCTFSVNTGKLQSKLKTLNITTFSLQSENKGEEINLSIPEEKPNSGNSKNIHDSFSQNQSNQKSIERKLIDQNVDAAPQPRNGANIDLLIDAIEAYAFNHHIMDADDEC